MGMEIGTYTKHEKGYYHIAPGGIERRATQGIRSALVHALDINFSQADSFKWEGEELQKAFWQFQARLPTLVLDKGVDIADCKAVDRIFRHALENELTVLVS